MANEDLGPYQAGVNLAAAEGADTGRRLGDVSTRFNVRQSRMQDEIAKARRMKAYGTMAGIVAGGATLGLASALPAATGVVGATGPQIAAPAGSVLGLGPEALRALAPAASSFAGNLAGGEEPAVTDITGGAGSIMDRISHRRRNRELAGLE